MTIDDVAKAQRVMLEENVAKARQIMLEAEKAKWMSKKDLVGATLHNFNQLEDLFPEDENYYLPRISERYTKELGLIIYSRRSKKENLEIPLGIYCESKQQIIVGPIDIAIDETKSKSGETKFLYSCSASECSDDCWFKKP
jgi:hypothetical protein